MILVTRLTNQGLNLFMYFQIISEKLNEELRINMDVTYKSVNSSIKNKHKKTIKM